MKTSDEWLVIGGGIGTVVLLFAIFQKANGKGPYAAQNTAQMSPENIDNAAPGAIEQSAFSPAPEDITVGATNIGGSSYNMGSNLFPFFGYAVQNNGLNSAYSAINALMGNNAQYQKEQDQVNNNFITAEAPPAQQVIAPAPAPERRGDEWAYHPGGSWGAPRWRGDETAYSHSGSGWG
jgi:hypothetical protein